MKHMPLQIISFTTLLLLAVSGTLCRVDGGEPELHIGKFSVGDLKGWKEETIWGIKKTVYSFVKENGKSVLNGKSVNAASGLLHKVDIDPRNYPVIRWSWKIDHTVKKGNERTKEGHDFAARLYVVFPRGLFSRTRAIEYVWGNVMTKGELLRSPYSKNAAMIAVDSGNDQAGKWVTHRRNYADDYRTAFGEEPPRVGAIAILTDSDNTGETAVGYYGDIDILAATKVIEPSNGESKTKEQPKESHPKPLQQQPDHQPAKELMPNDGAPKVTPGEQIKKEPQPPPDGSSAPPGGVPVLKPAIPGS